MAHRPDDPAIGAAVTRLVLAVDQHDTRATLALTAQLGASIGPVELVERLTHLVNSQGRATYGEAWPQILTDTINSFEIEALGTADEESD